jgi:3-deoxy-D-manno-octulosonic-acid transferase
MRRSLRKNQLLTNAMGRLLAGLIRTVTATSKTVHEPPDLIDNLRAQVPFILAMWHGQFMMLADLNTREFGVSAIVARHGDAEVMARVLEHFGISAIRGAGAGKRKKNRGGAYALRAALRALENNNIVAMTADVPASKPRIAGEGIVTLARLSGRPIIPVAASTSRFFTLNTWSRMTVNLPFSRLALTAGDPIFVRPDAGDAELERVRLEVERSLNTVTTRAFDLAKIGKRKAKQPGPNGASQRYQ